MSRLPYWALLIVLALAPLPFGANRPWSWSLLSLVIGILLIVWVLGALRDPGRVRAAWHHHWIATCLFLLLMVWAGVQAVTWTPQAWHHPLWREAGAALGAGLHGAVSLEPAAGAETIMRLLAYGGVFWLALQYCRSSRRARALFQTIAFSGFVYALYGLAVTFGGNETILWYERWAYERSLTSTFVNRNSFATYAGLTLIASFVILFTGERQEEAANPLSRRGLIAMMDRFSHGGWVYGLIIAATGVALILSHSRAGIAASALGLVAFFVALAAGRRLVGKALGVYGGIVAIAAVVIIIVAGQAAEGVNRSVEREERGVLFGYSVAAIEDFPVQGSGLGAWSEVFRLYRDETLVRSYQRAHSTYLEWASEMGLPATVLMIGTLLGLGAICFIGVRRRRNNQAYPAAGVAAGVLVASHSVVDFSLQIPAVSVVFAAMLGAACAQSRSGNDPQSDLSRMRR
ncbi:MAG: O-antigen ligase family protein [Alphaproteobacteria bacterium]